MSAFTTQNENGIAVITFNLPGEPVNKLTAAVRVEIEALLIRLRDDSSTRAVVVISGKPDSFIAGADIEEFTALTSQDAAERLSFEGQETVSRVETSHKPIVAAIHGACLGGALELALACDLRVMAADAVAGLPETRIGLIPDLGGCSRLPQLVGLGRAKELILTGRVVGAEEAERIGLVNRVAPAAELDAAVDALVAELLACAPVAVGLAKRALDASARPALSATLALELVAQDRCARTADFAEGARAAAERRAPAFTGA
ncbi:MAG: enoyl-CoA hydratase/isomerase family protein [Gemmatimonadales bacterium]